MNVDILCRFYDCKQASVSQDHQGNLFFFFSTYDVAHRGTWVTDCTRVCSSGNMRSTPSILKYMQLQCWYCSCYRYQTDFENWIRTKKQSSQQFADFKSPAAGVVTYRGVSLAKAASVLGPDLGECWLGYVSSLLSVIQLMDGLPVLRQVHVGLLLLR